MLGAPRRAGPEADKRGPRASDPPAGSRQGTRLDPRVGAATALRVARCTSARPCAATASGGGARQCNKAGPEQAWGGVHGDEEEAVDLTGESTDGVRRRAGGAAANGGCGRRATPTALHGEGRGWVRKEIGGGRHKEAPHARNWRGTHRGRRISDGNRGRGRRPRRVGSRDRVRV